MPTLIFGTKGAAAVLAEQEKMNKKTKELGGLYKQDVREARKLESAARRIYTGLRTPQEKVLRQIKLIARAHKEGFVDRPAAREGVERLRKKLVELNKVQGQTAKKADKTFNVGMVASIGASIAAALKFSEMLGTVNSQLDTIAEKQKAAASPLGNLAQLAGGDKGKLDLLIKSSTQTFSEGGFSTLGEAERLIFELESAGALNERFFFSLLQTVDDAASLAKSVSLVRKGFQGGDAVGTSQQVISKAIASATPAPGVSPSGILEAVALASSSAKKLGLTDEELFSAISRVAEVTGSASLAGTQVDSLFTSLINKGFADEGEKAPLAKQLEKIKKKNLSESELITFLGRKEAAKGFDVLGGSISGLAGRVGEVASAQDSGLAIKTIQNALSQDRIAAVRLSRAATARRELALDPSGQSQLLGKARRDIVLANRINRGGSAGTALTKEFLADQADSLSGGFFRRQETSGILDDFQKRSLEALEGLRDSGEKQLEEQQETNRKLNGKGLIGVSN